MIYYYLDSVIIIKDIEMGLKKSCFYIIKKLSKCNYIMWALKNLHNGSTA